MNSILQGVIAHILFSSTLTKADYSCACNYAVETPVYVTTSSSSQPIGYMYEFDCKPVFRLLDGGSNFYAIQFEAKVGYIQTASTAQIQTCSGEPQQSDLVPASTTTQSSFSTMLRTTNNSPSTNMKSSNATTTVSYTSKTSAFPSVHITNATCRTTSSNSSTYFPTSATIEISFPISKSKTMIPVTFTPPATTSSTMSNLKSSGQGSFTMSILISTGLQTNTSTKHPSLNFTDTPTTFKSRLPSTTHQNIISTLTFKSQSTVNVSITSMTASNWKFTGQEMITSKTTFISKSTRHDTVTSAHSLKSTEKQNVTSATQKIKTTTAITTIANTSQYQMWVSANTTGSPLQYIGVGYNLLTGNPYGDKFYTSDPGILKGRHILQLTNLGTSSVHEASYQRLHLCLNTTRTYILAGPKSYQDELLDIVRTNDAIDSTLKSQSFSLNTEFMKVQSYFKSESGTVLKDSVTSCTLGTARYEQSSAHVGNFTITKEFATAVCRLPLELNSQTAGEYTQFLDHWGTTIITEVLMGTRTIQRYVTNNLQVYGLVLQQDRNLIHHGGALDGYSTSLLIEPKAFQDSSSSQGQFGKLIETRTIGSLTQPEPTGFTLLPITDALKTSYWRQVTDVLIREGICRDSFSDLELLLLAQNVDNMLLQYHGKKETELSVNNPPIVDYPIRIPVTWPTGTYGLMETAYGCPGAKVTWLTGWRKQDTEDTKANSYFSPSINSFMQGMFEKSTITTNYCIKSTAVTGSYEQPWPPGAYCLLKHGACPSGFTEGFLYWDDEDIVNKNGHGGNLPDGTYNSNTKMFYCCRHDGNPSNEITDRSFILVRIGASCQVVYGMHVQDLFVRWDDNDDINKDSSGGLHPFDDGGRHDHLLHFCYYYSSEAQGPSIIG